MNNRANTAFQSIWYFTDLPDDIIAIIEKELVENFDKNVGSSPVFTKSEDHRDIEAGFDKVRNSKHAWVSSSHWIGGFLWHYVERANRENFLYDLKCLDNETIQYTIYDEGDYYEWHSDGGLTTHYKPQCIGNSTNGVGDDFANQNMELVRKLSFSLQLSLVTLGHIRPGVTIKAGLPVVGRHHHPASSRRARGIQPHIPIGFGIVAAGFGLDKPGMLI